jgi:branched-chain amino acid aminotransferase
VQDGELHTPTPDCFLDGITRRTVIGLARARQIKVVERAIMPDELKKTQEVFLTGSAAEITPVREVGNGEHEFTPGRITKQLIEDFTALTLEPAKWQKPAAA